MAAAFFEDGMRASDLEQSENQVTIQGGYLLPRSITRFPRLALVLRTFHRTFAHFPALGTGDMFSRAGHRLYVFPNWHQLFAAAVFFLVWLG